MMVPKGGGGKSKPYLVKWLKLHVGRGLQRNRVANIVDFILDSVLKYHQSPPL